MCDGLAAAQCARGKPRSQHSCSERCIGLCHDAQYRGRDTAAFPDSLSVDVTKSVAPAGSAAGRRASPTSRYSRVVGSRARTLAADLPGTCN